MPRAKMLRSRYPACADGKSEQHIADLFSEAGPGGEGALGAEPACTLLLLSPKPLGALKSRRLFTDDGASPPHVSCCLFL